MNDVTPLLKEPVKRLTSKQVAAIRAQVFERDGFSCRLAGKSWAGPCFGRLTPHHIRKSSQGGQYTVDNLATLCAHHNDELEADADLARNARGIGLVKRREDEK